MAARMVPLYGKGMIAMVAMIVLSIVIIERSEAPRGKLHRSSGRITYLNDLPPDGSRPRDPKKRYVVVDERAPVFLIFMGRDPGDLSPQRARLDSLHIGDRVDVYYDMPFTAPDGFNHLVFFIDHAGRPFFIRGSNDKILGWVLMALCVGTMAVLHFLKHRGRIG